MGLERLKNLVIIIIIIIIKKWFSSLRLMIFDVYLSNNNTLFNSDYYVKNK